MNNHGRLRKILAPLDGTLLAESILPYVESLSQAHQAHLELLHVIDPLAFADDKPTGLEREQVDEGRKYLRQLRSACQKVSVGTVCGLGPVVEVIRDRATSEHCDLIAFAPRGHSGVKRWLYGSVAEKVVRDAPCPVLLVRGEPHVCFQHVLMPLVEDDNSEQLMRGIQPFLQPETRLTLLHCCGTKPVHGEFRARLSRLVEERPNTHFHPSESKAPRGILDWAKDASCDLIAMSTHGQGGLHHLWKGSVMEEVARHSPCPVLVFPPDFKALKRS